MVIYWWVKKIPENLIYYGGNSEKKKVECVCFVSDEEKNV